MAQPQNAPAPENGAGTGENLNGNSIVLDAQRSFTAPEGLFQMPRMESGREVFEVDIPEGLQFTLADVALSEASLVAGAEIAEAPARGATGRVRIVVQWSHPVPAGSVSFRLRVYASPDARLPAPVVDLTEPSSHLRMRRLVEQDAPVDMAVGGPLVETFHQQILARGGEITDDDGSRMARSLDYGLSAGTIVVVLAVIAAICVAIGFATFGAVLIIAMQKGYNINDAGYQVAVGEGETRQEHKMVFNIRQPEG